MKLGAENKKEVGILAVLMLVAGYFVYSNLLSNPTPAPHPAAVNSRVAEIENAANAPSSGTAAPAKQSRALVNRNSKNDEFHPALHPKTRPGEQAIDPATIDPTLHLELLAKVQGMKLEGGQRNLLQFGAAPPPELPKKAEPVTAMKMYDYPRPVQPKPPVVKPPEPPPAPPSFKYYGLATKRIDNKPTAFFLDGEDIILAHVGMTVKGRWLVVRIGSDSVMLEDAQTKKQQPLAISEEAGAGSD